VLFGDSKYFTGEQRILPEN